MVKGIMIESVLELDSCNDNKNKILCPQLTLNFIRNRYCNWLQSNEKLDAIRLGPTPNQQPYPSGFKL